MLSDFNQLIQVFIKYGKVSVIDALEILKYSVNMDVTQPQWVFIEGDTDLSSVGRKDVNYSEDLNVNFADLGPNHSFIGIHTAWRCKRNFLKVKLEP